METLITYREYKPKKSIKCFDSTTGATWTLLGAIGGVVRVTVQLLGMKPLPPKQQIFWMILANAFISGFSGYMGATLMTQLYPGSTDLHTIAAGIAGYLGVVALDLFANWFKKKIE